jgi:hypothetical protein
MTINYCPTCTHDEKCGGCALLNTGDQKERETSIWLDCQRFEESNDNLPINPMTSCPGWTPKNISEPDTTKSCRERGDHYQNCFTCPDLTCCDNLNKPFEKDEEKLYFVITATSLMTAVEASTWLFKRLKEMPEAKFALVKAVSISSMKVVTQEIK